MFGTLGSSCGSYLLLSSVSLYLSIVVLLSPYTLSLCLSLSLSLSLSVYLYISIYLSLPFSLSPLSLSFLFLVLALKEQQERLQKEFDSTVENERRLFEEQLIKKVQYSTIGYNQESQETIIITITGTGN